MRLTTKGRFAVTAMLDLALHGANGPVTLSGISERQKISLSYLEQLFGKLRRSGLDKTADSDFTKVAPGLFPEVQFWWTLPQLLRSNDESLLNGATWDELLREAIVLRIGRAAQLFLLQHKEDIPMEMLAHVADEARRDVRVGVDSRTRRQVFGVRGEFGG